MYEDSETINSYLTEKEFIQAVYEQYPEEQDVYQLRMTDFEDIALKKAYSREDVVCEDVKVKYIAAEILC